MISGTPSGPSTAISPTSLTSSLSHEESDSIKTSEVAIDVFKVAESTLKEQLKPKKQQGKVEFAIGLFFLITSVTLVTIPLFLYFMNKSSEKIDKYKTFKTDLRHLRDLNAAINTRLTLITAANIALKLDPKAQQKSTILAINKLKDHFSKNTFINSKGSIIDKEVELDKIDLITYLNQMKTSINNQLRNYPKSVSLGNLIETLKIYQEKLKLYQDTFIEVAPGILLSQHQNNSLTPSDKTV